MKPTVLLGSDMSAEQAADLSAKLAGLGVLVKTNGLPPPSPDGPKGRVIVVVSPKGGSGKTAVTSNVATALAERHPGQVVAVDLDVQFGDLCTTMSLQPEHNLSHLARTNQIDATSVKVFLTPYGDSGLYVLCSASAPVEADVVTADHVTAVLPLLAQDFAYVIVDTSAGLDDRTLAAIECATDLVLVSSLDVTSIRSLRKLVEAMDKIGVKAARRFVLNRADSRVGITPRDAEAVVGMPVAVGIPSNRDMPLSMNVGTPVVTYAPKSSAAKQLRILTDQFSAPVEADKRRWRR